jgi:hypothetical protein
MIDFFNFGSKLLSSTFQASSIGLKEDPSDDISVYDRLIKGKYEGIAFPVNFKQEYGRNLADIIDTGWAGFYLISDRLKDILEKNHLTGWKTFPIKLYDKKEKEISGYYGFSVTGMCGNLTFKDSDIIEKKLIPSGPLCRFYKGVHINLDEWDNCDFFTPVNSSRTIVTRGAAEILKKNKISNLNLQNLTEIETTIVNFGSLKNLA